MSNLSPAAVDVLRRSAATAESVHLPVHLPAITAYREVNAFLERQGGRWDPRERAYRFSGDPRPALERETGAAVLPPASGAADKALSFWATPPALAAELVDSLDLEAGARVLEPSAGEGALVAAVRDARPTAYVLAVEVDAGRTRLLHRRFRTAEKRSGWCRPAGHAVKIVGPMRFQDYAEACAEDQEDRDPEDRRPFDAVVMNPPFTEPGDRYAWATHLQLAWSLLRPGGQRPGGTLRAIVPASIEYGRQRPIAAARQLIQDAGGFWRPAGEGAFRASGTGVRTMIVEATRPGTR